MSFKIPSIHWRIPEGDRKPEKRAGLISGSEKDYSRFFEIAKKNQFRIIFDGLALDRHEQCHSDPQSVLSTFKQFQNEYEVDVVGENVYPLGQGSTIDSIMRDSNDLFQVIILRMEFQNERIFDKGSLKTIQAKLKANNSKKPFIDVQEPESSEEESQE